VPGRLRPVPEPLTPTEITAGRLHLRPWQAGDAPAVLAACQDPEIARWTAVPQPYTAEVARAWVEQLAPAEWAEGRGAPFAVLDAVDGTLLGSTALMRLDAGAAEVGYWVAPGARGRGVATEALGAVCRWGVGALGLGRLTWLAYVGNDGSRRVAERVGFAFEGTLRGYLPWRDGTRRDAWVAGLLPADLR
jgi:RimJ/RimL family protein N-acetyltransferase